MYVLYNVNIDTRSCNNCCTGEAVNVTYSECLFVVLIIQHAKYMRHIVIRGLPASTIFFRIITQTPRFSEKKKVIEHKMCFDFLYNFCPKHFSL